MTAITTASDVERWRLAYAQVRGRLLAERGDRPYWLGRLADSALATATAVAALAMATSSAGSRPDAVAAGLTWLAQDQNDDGGWGDSPESPSNPTASILVVSAMRLAGQKPNDAAWSYIRQQGGAKAMLARYGDDRTFSAPILTVAALAGLADWSDVPTLPMELAALPHWLLRLAGVPVVSYA
ncbi:MAG: squalene--hopene cyclase, partial [Planctomycetes bacterium]|nr:squalene--hopene cyclase [Planctomycetota bacterium]